MKRIIKTLVVVMAMMIAAIPSCGTAFAKKAFSLSPMSQNVVLAPGETYRGSLKVSNPVTSTVDFNYIVTVSSYYRKQENGSIDDYGGTDYEKKTNMNMIVDWTKVDNPTGVIAPNNEQTITFTITVPADAPAGGQYMALLVSEDPDAIDDTAPNSSIKEVMQMAHVVYAEVAGETRNEGAILENNVPSFSTSNVFKTSAMVRNDGNIHAEVKYTLQVWPIFSDEEICTNEENPENTLILPNTQKYYSQECNLPMIGIFRAKQTVKIFGEESIVEKTIVVCPLWLIFVIIFGIVFLIAWLVARSKKRSSRSDD